MGVVIRLCNGLTGPGNANVHVFFIYLEHFHNKFAGQFIGVIGTTFALGGIQ